MKNLLFMLAVVGIVLFACGTKDSEDSLEIKNISAHDKAMEIAGTAQKESEKGNKDIAIKIYDEALKIKEIPAIFAYRGMAKIYIGDFNGAVMDLTKAINNDEKRLVYYIARVCANAELKKYNISDVELIEIAEVINIEIKQGNKNVLKHFEDALGWLKERALNLPFFVACIGVVKKDMGDSEGAIADLTKAINEMLIEGSEMINLQLQTLKKQKSCLKAINLSLV